MNRNGRWLMAGLFLLAMFGMLGTAYCWGYYEGEIEMRDTLITRLQMWYEFDLVPLVESGNVSISICGKDMREIK